MKKILSMITAVLLTASAFADLHSHEEGRRYVEVGFNSMFEVDQNFKGLSEVMKKELVIDLTEVADSLGPDGLVFHGAFGQGLNFKYGIKKNWGVGIDIKIEGSGLVSTGKGLFDFLGHGTDDGSLSTNLGAEAEAYLDIAVPAHFIINNFKISVAPSYYIPLLYIPHTQIPFKAESGKEGYTFHAKASADVPVYSLFNLKDTDEDVELNAANGGISLAAAAEYKLLYFLDVGAYVDIPVTPGKTGYLNTYSVNFESSVPSLMEMVSGDTDIEITNEAEFTAAEKEEHIYFKPFRAGGELAYKPFGDYFVLHGRLGVVARNPWSKDFDSEYDVFPEFRFGGSAYMFKGLGPGADLSVAYENKLWQTGLLIRLNVRAVEMDIGASLASTTFEKMFTGAGAKLVWGMKFGW